MGFYSVHLDSTRNLNAPCSSSNRRTAPPLASPPHTPTRRRPFFNAQVWEQIGGHRRHHTSSTVANFRLNILGETVEAFSVPGASRV